MTDNPRNVLINEINDDYNWKMKLVQYIFLRQEKYNVPGVYGIMKNIFSNRMSKTYGDFQSDKPDPDADCFPVSVS